MTYLLLGENYQSKDQKITELKKKLFPRADHQTFNCETLYADKLEASALKKSFLTLPVLTKKRLVIIRQSHKLSDQNQELIVEFLKQQLVDVDLILESDQWNPSHEFIKKIGKWVKIAEFAQDPKQNVFDMTQAIGARKPVEALKILYQLISDGVHPLQILGAVIWFWGKSRVRIKKEHFQTGLLAIQEADWNIKRSRMKADYCVEVLVVKLCSC